MEFASTELKKYLLFIDLILDLPRIDQDEPSEEGILNNFLFLMSSLDPWYRNILVYLQTMWYPRNFSHEEQRKLHLHVKNYLIIDNTLYC